MSKSKSSEKKLVHMPSDPELEPGKELIMCAKLTIKTPKSYQKDVDKYIRITRYVRAIISLVLDQKSDKAIWGHYLHMIGRRAIFAHAMQRTD